MKNKLERLERILTILDTLSVILLILNAGFAILFLFIGNYNRVIIHLLVCVILFLAIIT